MYAPGGFFGTEDVSGFASVFLIYGGDRDAQVVTLQKLAAIEPDSPSGQGAANWLRSQGLQVETLSSLARSSDPSPLS